MGNMLQCHKIFLNILFCLKRRDPTFYKYFAEDILKFFIKKDHLYDHNSSKLHIQYFYYYIFFKYLRDSMNKKDFECLKNNIHPTYDFLKCMFKYYENNLGFKLTLKVKPNFTLDGILYRFDFNFKKDAYRHSLSTHKQNIEELTKDIIENVNVYKKN
jgi:hypothetical protein